MCKSLIKILGGKERPCTIEQTFSDCQFEIDLTERVIDPITHEQVQFSTREAAEEFIKNNPIDGAVKIVPPIFLTPLTRKVRYKHVSGVNSNVR